MHVYTHIHASSYIHVFPICPVRGPGSSDTPAAISTPNTQILTSKYHSLLKKPGLLGEITDSTAGARKYKMNLEYLNTKKQENAQIMRIHQKRQSSLKALSLAK